MDALSLAFYQVCFERDFLKKASAEFQELFCEIMETRYPGDFHRVVPWGRRGDLKNDGYLQSKRCIFQVYAPNEVEAAKTITKIEADFLGALEYWRRHFDTWTFVHNSRKGLPPDVELKLLDLGAEHAPVAVSSWGYAELWNEARQLSHQDLLSLLGPVPSRKDLLGIRFEDLKPVLLTVARQRPIPDGDIRPVPMEKLTINRLSPNVATMLKCGMAKAGLVGQFFAQWHDPTLGDRVADSLRREYDTLRASELAPDEIFYGLQQFAGGELRGNPGHESAVLAVLAYYFEACDIFEATASPAV